MSYFILFSRLSEPTPLAKISSNFSFVPGTALSLPSALAALAESSKITVDCFASDHFLFKLTAVAADLVGIFIVTRHPAFPLLEDLEFLNARCALLLGGLESAGLSALPSQARLLFDQITPISCELTTPCVCEESEIFLVNSNIRLHAKVHVILKVNRKTRKYSVACQNACEHHSLVVARLAYRVNRWILGCSELTENRQVTLSGHIVVIRLIAPDTVEAEYIASGKV